MDRMKELNALVGSYLTGAYKTRRMKQEDLALRADIPLPTLQKKLKGRAPVLTSELFAIAAAMVPPLDPRKAIDDIQDLWEAQHGRLEPVSEDAGTNDLQRKRNEKEAVSPSPTTEELDRETKRAAIGDPEIGTDEDS